MLVDRFPAQSVSKVIAPTYVHQYSVINALSVKSGPETKPTVFAKVSHEAAFGEVRDSLVGRAEFMLKLLSVAK